MKNVRESQLKKCIFLTLDEFGEVINELTNGFKKVEYEFGVYLSDTNKAEESETCWDGNILEELSKYFDVEVTSYHADDCEYPCVWICYK